ncbi:MAG: bifunctional precorrin-2 dehydrogenase/sirohydrochlorin ferrochelatase [Syntrophomonadaceae bacterium]|nr:bifunctional precorrin-2 dehydrogenase/sirohydrochlorin ferrochelatase [Syntrophomonadaceae bacterium]
MENHHFYPIYINLHNKSCLIVGGGLVAERKVSNLLDYGANVIVVSPQVTPIIDDYADKGLITLIKRTFEPEDLDDIFIVFIATDDSDTNQFIADLCRTRKILVNAVDDPPNCDFFVPAVVRRGSLAVAISTEGKSPMLARHLRMELEDYFVAAYEEYVDLLGEYREIIKNNVPDINVRRKIFAALVNSDILDLLKAGERLLARERVEQCISSWQD